MKSIRKSTTFSFPLFHEKYTIHDNPRWQILLTSWRRSAWRGRPTSLRKRSTQSLSLYFQIFISIFVFSNIHICFCIFKCSHILFSGCRIRKDGCNGQQGGCKILPGCRLLEPKPWYISFQRSCSTDLAVSQYEFWVHLFPPALAQYHRRRNCLVL